MAYKKYIKKDGKLYGPYIYESHRIDGRVISEYHGIDNSKSRKLIWMIAGLLAFAVLFFFVFHFGGKLTGFATSGSETKVIYPAVYFTLISKQIEINETSQGLVNDTQADNSTDTSADNFTNQSINSTQTPSTENSSANSSTPTNSTAPITGGVIGSSEQKVIEKQIKGEVDANYQFVYELKEGETVELLAGSVKTDLKNLSDDTIQLNMSRNKAIISTSYYEIEKTEQTEKNNKNAEDKKTEKNETIFQNNLTVSNITVSNNTTQEINLSNEVLREEEKSILSKEFGNASIETTKSELFNGRYIIGYKLGDYEIEYSYDSKLNNETLNLQMENDRVKWLRDMIKSISQQKSSHETAEKFIQNYSLS